jgi:hypothetical protein
MQDETQSEQFQIAEMLVANPEFQAATAIRDRWAIGSEHKDRLVTAEFEKQLHTVAADIVAGSDAHLQRMLIAQLETLNSLFYKMIGRVNAAEYVDSLEIYADMALQIQNQARRTVATLVDIQRPKRTTFVKQANIAENQQINLYLPDVSENFPEYENQVSELPNVTALDDRAKEEAIGKNSTLEALGEIYGSKVPGG